MDENLDVLNESTQQHECISGSTCVDNIRKRLSPEVERRMFALVRSANGSTRDLEIYHERAHGFLPKAPIRKEKVKEVLAPLWLKRFPPSDFPDSIYCDDDSLSTSASLCSELACTTEDIAQKLLEIDELFRENIHGRSPDHGKRRIYNLLSWNDKLDAIRSFNGLKDGFRRDINKVAKS